ncbi:putative baseplate assembly protein [Blastococcus saxobsidens]|uniref:Uncharacterized protein n=1 Tax=Blastococcus saxobsidens (strain DD2) TaxID=1146883 RepID=H6RPG8_BLASD|nr:putative baseplate assembly protein [Blastococcus saxobsidens]CCG04027.1 protein of unknown function [Blastococcus saxobsidens DD2]
MDPLLFRCADAEARRAAVTGHPQLNAMDWLEVADLVPGELPADEQATYAALPAGPHRDQLLWQRKLVLHFVNPLTATHQAALTASGISISGGQRIPAPMVAVLSIGTDRVTVRATSSGDTSRYRLDLVRSAVDRRPPVGFDPLLHGIDFSFTVDCPTDLDCRLGHVCVGTHQPEPGLDRLAKDYSTFRRLMLDRVSLLSPEWGDRSPADLAVTLVELFAWTGDRLSYQQDAVATEAYLATARLRRSVRRHARLVDYAMHDGCNARTWVQVRVTADLSPAPSELTFLTRVPGLPDRITPGSREETVAFSSGAQWFEPMVASLDRAVPAPPLRLFAAHDAMGLYDWGLPEFALATGTREAALAGHFPDLEPGDVLVLAQTRSAVTGLEADADPTLRHPVRVVEAEAFDGGAPITDPLTGTRVTRVAWAAEDALPFSLCVTSSGDIAAGRPAVSSGSEAWGNMVLADHGRTVTERLGQVTTGRYRPELAEGPLTQAATTSVRRDDGERQRLRFDPDAPAAAAVRSDPATTRPELTPTSTLEADSTEWTAVPDLLDSGAEDPHLVAEVEADGSCHLRFGAHGHGRPPRVAEAFSGTYRVGNGVEGNVGTDAVGHVVTLDARVAGVRNPLPAYGGTAPETIAQVRRRAPEAFRTQQRAVTPADYERVAVAMPGVQRAAAEMRWTGSWHTVFLTVDPAGETVLDAALEKRLREHVEPFRAAGHDLEVDGPRFVALELELEVCVAPEYFRADVRRRLGARFSAVEAGDGSRGLFHPDSFTFGQPVHLSPVLAAASAVPGVESVRARVFGRLGSPSPLGLQDGRLLMGRLEVARLENDPDFPEHGVLRLVLHGGT